MNRMSGAPAPCGLLAHKVEVVGGGGGGYHTLPPSQLWSVVWLNAGLGEGLQWRGAAVLVSHRGDQLWPVMSLVLCQVLGTGTTLVSLDELGIMPDTEVVQHVNLQVAEEVPHCGMPVREEVVLPSVRHCLARSRVPRAL